MFSPTMRTAVLQATALFTISTMLNHHMSKNMFEQVLENEGWLNMTKAMKKSTHSASTTSNMPGQLALDAGDATNQTLPRYQNNSIAIHETPNAAETPPESFYRQSLPMEVVIFLVLSALQYWWFIALEKMLPARPSRYKEVAQYEAKVEESEDREEEVVKRWIAQDMTVGKLWYYTVEYGVWRVLFKLPFGPSAAPSGLSRHLTVSFISGFFSIAPLMYLVALIIIPAHARIIFLAGVNLIETIFLKTLVRIFAAWAVKTDFVQQVMRSVTAKAEDPNFNRHGDGL